MLERIKVEGYIGRWHEIDREVFEGVTYILLEHDTYGDMTCGLIVKEDLSLVCETFDSIECALVDEGIIDIDKLHGGEY